jgi:hypothetical protein
MLLPPKLADLPKQLPRPTRRSTLPEAPAPDRLLFPGRTPDRPVDDGGFGKLLKRSGLTIPGGRNTGLIGLAAELPAAVLADLLAIDIAVGPVDAPIHVSHSRGVKLRGRSVVMVPVTCADRISFARLPELLQGVLAHNGAASISFMLASLRRT